MRSAGIADRHREGRENAVLVLFCTAGRGAVHVALTDDLVQGRAQGGRPGEPDRGGQRGQGRRPPRVRLGRGRGSGPARRRARGDPGAGRSVARRMTTATAGGWAPAPGSRRTPRRDRPALRERVLEHAAADGRWRARRGAAGAGGGAGPGHRGGTPGGPEHRPRPAGGRRADHAGAPGPGGGRPGAARRVRRGAAFGRAGGLNDRPSQPSPARRRRRLADRGAVGCGAGPAGHPGGERHRAHPPSARESGLGGPARPARPRLRGAARPPPRAASRCTAGRRSCSTGRSIRWSPPSGG